MISFGSSDSDAMMPASNASSPASAASPQVLAPSTKSTVNKPLAPNLVALQKPSIFTNKEWVIPPRPKPGRKPAADTPPTKRKAQNRAAQRAFRERRAARVGDLEEQMKKMEEEDEREQEELRAQIRQLEADVDHYSSVLSSWQEKMQELEMNIKEERRMRQNAETELVMLRSGQPSSTDTVPLPPRRSGRPAQNYQAEERQNSLQSQSQYDELPMGCGNCSQNSRCECIEQAFDLNNIGTDNLDTSNKRPHSPQTTAEQKRVRHDLEVSAEETEIDFTAQYASKHSSKLNTSTSSASMAPVANPDPCGFCQDGSPCICAEMAVEAAKSNATLKVPSSTNPCVNGPGTCAQCLSSADSTLFCKSLAATRPGYIPNNQDQQSPSQNNSLKMITCPTPNATPPASPWNGPSNGVTTGVTLTCADAYQTLSRHPAFEQASQELSTWMPKLATVPGGKERTAFEVEAASVMGVLRFFDRRFGVGQQSPMTEADEHD